MAIHLSYERSVLLRFTSIGNKVQSLLLEIGSQLVLGVGHSQPHVVQMLYGDQVVVWGCDSDENAVGVSHRDSIMRSAACVHSTRCSTVAATQRATLMSHCKQATLLLTADSHEAGSGNLAAVSHSKTKSFRRIFFFFPACECQFPLLLLLLQQWHQEPVLLGPFQDMVPPK